MKLGWLQDLLRAFAGPPRPSVPPHVVICPTPGSEDLLELIDNPGALRRLRQTAGSFQWYSAQLARPAHPMVGANTLDALQGIEAFAKLTLAGFAQAIEVPALKPWSQETQVYVDHALACIEASGGRIRTVALDEPWQGAAIGGLGWDDRQIAWFVAEVIKGIRAGAPGVQVGLIEAYPAMRPGQLRAALARLQLAGAEPSFVRLDPDANYCRQIGWSVCERELREIQTLCREHQRPLSVAIWGCDDLTPARFCMSAQNLVSRLRWAFGAAWPEEIVIQSWSKDGDDPRRVPPIGRPGELGDTLCGLVEHTDRTVMGRLR